MKRVVAALAVATIISGGSVVLSESASAAQLTCSQGYACGYVAGSYDSSGAWQGISYNAANFAAKVASKINSAWANGGSCKYTNFYRQYNQEGSFFTLYSQTLLASNYRDPNLSNGVGFNGAGINFANDIDSIKFTGCS